MELIVNGTVPSMTYHPFHLFQAAIDRCGINGGCKRVGRADVEVAIAMEAMTH